jgi:acetoin utilization deacetylase AcuC-like enzyme
MTAPEQSPLVARSATPDSGSVPRRPAQASNVTAYYTHRDCAAHEMGAGHPECPERLHAIDDQMTASGMSQLVDHHEAGLAEDADLVRAHSAAHVEAMRNRSPSHGYAQVDPDTVMNRFTLRAALCSAGAAIAATDAVVSGVARNAFCCIRPPGHHAGRDFGMGFCFFNNIAVAARRALDVHGFERVAVVDFDVHHGNGTQDIFANDPQVLMVGIFQHPFYPYNGVENTAPNMVNVPLKAGSGGEQLRAAFTDRCLPALEAFRPQMIFISAGFDAHREDDMGNLRMVENDYAWITQRIIEVADRFAEGRIVSCLEGGYNLSALGRSVVAHVKALAT